MPLKVGAERMELYLPLLAGKRVGVITNATGLIGNTHLVDSLIALKMDVVKVFAPEHGFRGDADAGELVSDGRDPRTGVPLVSLYGKNKKPSVAQLQDVDVLLFDIQDVGVRFYTYTSTLHYAMEAAAEQHRKVIVLDRPNPNGFYIDGPILDTAHRSFVGMHPVPLVHGMTIGEYARMINGEKWLKKGVQCELEVVPCSGYDHTVRYALPVRPSPNLPNMEAVYLYPSIGLFEGTPISVGRGTEWPFQCIGTPGGTFGDFTFTPVSRPGAKDPPHKDRLCKGLDLRAYGKEKAPQATQLNLDWLLTAYGSAADRPKFFSSFFDVLAGGPTLRKAIQAGQDESSIRSAWKPGLEAFSVMRTKYLLYP
ncbi:MAG TPA: DUF1343 domain-containing protein [Flavobacteriales bacterium]